MRPSYLYNGNPILVWRCLYIEMAPESCCGDGFVAAGGIGTGQNHLHCCHWRQSCHHDNLLFAVSRTSESERLSQWLFCCPELHSGPFYWHGINWSFILVGEGDPVNNSCRQPLFSHFDEHVLETTSKTANAFHITVPSWETLVTGGFPSQRTQ